MKRMIRKLLPLVLALAAMGVLFTTTLAAKTDTLTLSSSPEEGPVVIESSRTPFFVIAKVTDAKGVTITDQYDFTYRWTLNDEYVSLSNYYEFTPDSKISSYTLTCLVTATHKTDRTVKTAELTWYPTVQNQQNIELTVSQNLKNYYFNDTQTQTGDSVYSRICEILDIRSASELSKYDVTFIPNYSQVATYNGPVICKLNELDKVYLALSGSGTWITQYSVLKNDNVVLSGVLTIDVEPSIDINNFYSAAPGESVVIPAEDITEFWRTATGGRATLQYVYVTSCTGVNGVLCYNHTAAEKNHTNAYGLIMYANPSLSIQTALSDLTFVPVKLYNKYPTGSVTVTISATGTDANKKDITVTGTFVILYTEGKIDTISYDCTGSHVMLSGSDFDAVYRAATGSTVKEPVYNIRFLDLPTYGTLYRGYDPNNYAGMNSLTEGNISLLTFSSRSTAENSLDQLAYVPRIAAKGDTVRYVAYSGSTILYVGTVNFNTRELVITYTTSSPTMNFSSLDFYTSGSPLLNAPFVVFGTPSSGKLYKDYENGTIVTANDYFSYNTAYGVRLLDDITFVPKEGFVGVVEIPFAAQSLTGGVVSGKVRIYVVQNVFADVDPNNWAAPYINRLYATGVINGTSATTFSPNDNMTYGAALKMILLAAGYPKQAEPSGTNWATNYLSLAYRHGIVSSMNIDLNAAVTRETIAEIAAKALGLEIATALDFGVIGPVDCDNGYVYALYNAGILNGSFVGGSNYFYGYNFITRAEVSKIICKINDYKN